MGKAIKAEIERWRWQHEREEALRRSLRIAQQCVARAHDEGVAAGIKLATQPDFKAMLNQAITVAARGWAPSALVEFAKFQSHFRDDNRARWQGPDLTAQMDLVHKVARVEIRIPAVYTTFQVVPW